jgi:hypothetical protein
MSPSGYKPACGYTVLAMVEDDLALLPENVRDALNARRPGVYDACSPDNWRPFGNTVICGLIHDVARECGVRAVPLTFSLAHTPNAAELFRVFAQTDLYIIDCASLVIPRLADLAVKIELAAHRSASFFVPFDFGDALTPQMRSVWNKMSLLEFAREPSAELREYQNLNIYHEVLSEAGLRNDLTRVMKELQRERWGAGRPQPGTEPAELRYTLEGPRTIPTLLEELT